MRPILFIAILLATFGATAANETPSTQCDYSGTQQEMNKCAVRDFEMADKLLNETYRKTMLSLTPIKKKLLRREQREWLRQLDPQCREEAKLSEGGSMWPIDYFSCMESYTNSRINELEQWHSNN